MLAFAVRKVVWLVECCFTSTETLDLLGTGALTATLTCTQLLNSENSLFFPLIGYYIFVTTNQAGDCVLLSTFTIVFEVKLLMTNLT